MLRAQDVYAILKSKINSGGGSGGGTTNYNQLTNKPRINGIELSGNKTLDDLGIQPKGDYITSDTEIPEVDNTLSVSGNAADAKVTGDKFDEIDEALENMSANFIEF